MDHSDRVVILVDMDCFYCQVEEKLDPTLEGKPIAVVQYNAWKGGGIIAVNYTARDRGVTRHMRGDEAKQLCPEIILVSVPTVREKADLSKYREAGKKVAEVLKEFTPLLERASVDEAYLDITEAVNQRINSNFDQIKFENMQNTHVVGCDAEDFIQNVHTNRDYSETNGKLAMGGVICEEIRAEVFKKSGYRCSAGIAHNKILAKLACGLHKPNKQTILPQESIQELFKDLPIKRIKNLGGKFGMSLSEDLNIKYVGELIKFSVKQLMEKYDEKNAKWLYNISRGVDTEPVTIRLVPKSIGCSKRFPGKNALLTGEAVEHWINELSTELWERLEQDLDENNRRGKQMVVSFAQETSKKEDISGSRTVPLNSYKQSKIAKSALEVINKFCLKPDGTFNIKFLGISAGNFEENKKIVNITTLFKNMNESKSLKEKSTSSEVDVSKCKDTDKALGFSSTSRSSLNGDNQNFELDEIGRHKGEASFEEQINNENDSIYSATTEDLNEDTSNLMYYEDIFPDSVSSQPIFNDQLPPDNCSTVSVNALNSPDDVSDDKLDIRKSSSRSFFTKYFEHCLTDNRSNSTSSPFKTHVENSNKIYIKKEEFRSNIDDNNSPLRNNQENCVTDQTQVTNEEFQNVIQPIALNICSICNKKIPTQEMVSHMDFHYALKIVKEEEHLYRPSQSTKSPTREKVDKKSVGQSTKKKIVDTKPISDYLVKEAALNDDNSELCLECHKKIKLSEIGDHFDYHAAKKLQLELNLQSSGVKSNYKGDKGLKKDTGISKYFIKPA